MKRRRLHTRLTRQVPIGALPQALATVRAPIFEEKVVDFLVELAKVTEKAVSREELYKEEEDEAPAAGGQG